MNEIIDWKTEILPVLEQISDKGVNVNIMRKLFIEKLNYDFIDQVTVIEFPESIKKKVLSTEIISEKNGFKILFCKIDTLLKGIELPVVKNISRYHPANIIIFTNRDCDEAHFINTKYVGKERDKKVKGFRRITVGKTDRLRTAAERLSEIYADDAISALALMAKCEEAFDVEAVSKEFYREFVEKYKELRNAVRKNNKLRNRIADDLTQEIINRLLFLYFIQKKGWLNEDYRFLYNNFKLILSAKQGGNKEYYKNFLVPLFKKLSIKYFKYPEFEKIPFLNGGLFEFQEIEEKVSIPNESFKDIFDDLLERFNFTIREDTEFEEEVAIDPEMLGKIFEELILSIEAEKYKDIPDPRRASGSYYTPRFIVSFMVKQSLLNYLTNELPEIPKERLKLLIFRSSIDGIDNPEVIKETLLNLRIVDPGVGSGAFSVDILNKLVNLIEVLNKKLGKSKNRFDLRKKLIEDCIYGVDIQPRAVYLARLRLWLSLIVDLDVDNPVRKPLSNGIEKLKDIPPLINLDFKIIKGDSLVSKICGFKFDLKTLTHPDQKILELIEKYKELKDEYSEAVNDAKKRSLKEKVNKTKCDIAIWHLKNIKKSRKEDIKQIGAQGTLFEKTKKETRDEEQKRKMVEQEISAIDKEIKKIKTNQGVDAFNWHLDFFEVMGEKEGFDIVIANPPYGVAVDREVYQDEFGLVNKDSYGVFAALGVDILKPGGTLCYIMSDTWQTIRTHYRLRKKLFEETETQYIISVPMKTFRATVNTGIYLFKKSSINKDKDNFIIAADFHGLDIKTGDLEAGFDMLMEEDTFDETKDGYTIISDREMAIYAYRQKIIKKYSNLSFFIASPKLFKLMQDVGNLKPKTYTDEKGIPVIFDIKKQRDLFEQEGSPVYQVDFNDKEIELVKLGDIAEVKKGLATGDNKRFYFKENYARGNYNIFNPNLVLRYDELENLSDEERIKGIIPLKHSGRYLVPLDKGEESDIESNWLPNYWVKYKFYIDWSKKAVKNIYALGGMRNPHHQFKKGISFSWTGFYAPTFRINTGCIFDQSSSCIFQDMYQVGFLLGMLNAKVLKYFIKSYADHTVNSTASAIKKMIVIYKFDKNVTNKIIKLVEETISSQKQNPRYDYLTNEQIEIDKLVYQMYNLNEEDIKEVENWYFRRYPKLAKIIEEKSKIKNKGV